MQNSNYTKISLGQNTHPPVQSSVYGGSQPNIFSNSLQSGVYHPIKASSHNIQQQQVNYQLVNEYSSFNRPPSSVPHQVVFQPQE